MISYFIGLESSNLNIISFFESILANIYRQNLLTFILVYISKVHCKEKQSPKHFNRLFDWTTHSNIKFHKLVRWIRICSTLLLLNYQKHSKRNNKRKQNFRIRSLVAVKYLEFSNKSKKKKVFSKFSEVYITSVRIYLTFINTHRKYIINC